MNIQVGHFKFKLTLHPNYLHLSVIQVAVWQRVIPHLHTRGWRDQVPGPEDVALGVLLGPACRASLGPWLLRCPA